MADAGTHLFWITSRAAGICALVLASLAVSAGLAMGRSGANPARLRTLHEALSLGTLAALAVHTLSLLGDGYLRPSLADLAIPFVGPYRPVWTAVRGGSARPGRRSRRLGDASSRGAKPSVT